jgi:transposase
VANARKLRLIYANKRKTDEVDAENLARLARLDPKLLYPVRHRDEGSQAHMAILCSRQALVGCRTQLVNHVRGAVKSFGHRLPKCPARSFHKNAAEHIPEALLPALEPILEQIASLTERIRDYDRKLETVSEEHYPEKPRSWARSRALGRSRRFASCSPWKIPTASRGAARWEHTWGWCQGSVRR